MLLGVLNALPSPVHRERSEHMMKWAEMTRLPRRVRDMQSRVEGVSKKVADTAGIRICGDAAVLDLLPLWGVIGGEGVKYARRGIREICCFPLRGRPGRGLGPGGMDDEMEVEDAGGGERGLAEVGTLGRGEMDWIVEDDIED